jgi:phosphoglycolate phosphatase-like HAD superfamily hydrolase
MGIIADLLGTMGSKKAASRTIADVEGAIERLTAERATARAAVSSAIAERDGLLLHGTDEEIESLDRAADRHRLVLDRLEALEPVLLQELATARGAAKAAKWQELRSRYDAAATDFVLKARPATAALEALARIRGEAQLTGFSSEAGTFHVAPNILAPDLIAMFEFSVESQRDATARRAQAPKAVAAIPPKQPAKSASAPSPAVTPPKAAATPKPAKPAFEAKADKAGNTSIYVLRPGLEVAGRGRATGDVVSLPFDEAMRVVGTGAAEFAEAVR